MKETLHVWGERLRELGFSPEYYQSMCGSLQSIDWYNGEEHISTEVYATPEYDKYLDSLGPDEEYEPDYKQYIVNGVTVYTPEFAYPEGHWRDDRWDGNIRLTNNSFYENFHSLSWKNFEKALWMSRNPIQAKNEIARKYMDEVDKFFKIHGETIETLGWKQKESSFLLVGYWVQETEPNISFKYKGSYCDELTLHYNMWTEKLAYHKYVESEIKGAYGTNYEINVNELSKEEFREYAMKPLLKWGIINNEGKLIENER